MKPHIPSPEEIDACKTPAGAWSRATLAEWGVPWPPPKGWRKELTRKWEKANGITSPARARDFEIPKGITAAERKFHVKRATMIAGLPGRSADLEVYAHVVLAYEASLIAALANIPPAPTKGDPDAS